MKFVDALPYVAKIVDTALSVQDCIGSDAGQMLEGKKCKLVGWQCGFEPHFIAVVDAYGCEVEDDEAEEIAVDYLEEQNWFADEIPELHEHDADRRIPDYVIGRADA